MISQFLDQLLKSGESLLQHKGASSNIDATPTQAGGELGKMLSGFGGGALTGGAIGLLLGNKKARQIGGSLAAYGGLAALGVMAYKAYNNHKNATRSEQPNIAMPPMQTVDRVPAPQVEQHSQAILKALIAASKADGHVDDNERRHIQTAIEKMTADAALRQWVTHEINKPLDPHEVAQSATTPEIAAEMYLASVMMIDEENFMERSYLNELARLLRIDDTLKQALEAQVQGARQHMITGGH